MTPEQFWQSYCGGKHSKLAEHHGICSRPTFVVKLITEYHQLQSAQDKERIASLEAALSDLLDHATGFGQTVEKWASDLPTYIKAKSLLPNWQAPNP